jgi:hypothetical protein
MTDKQSDKLFLKELVTRGASADEGYFEYAHIVACLLDKRLREQLAQLANGPTYDGDVVGKCGRDELLDMGLAVRVCHKGEQGYTGATYFALPVLKRINEIKSGQIGA